jgi:hypothetical protein
MPDGTGDPCEDGERFVADKRAAWSAVRRECALDRETPPGMEPLFDLPDNGETVSAVR